MIRFAAIFISAVLAACAPTSVGKRAPVMILDNHGGFSHGGQRIELFDDGAVAFMTYTDVVGDRTISHGSYELSDGVLMLRSGDRGNRTLHRVAYQGKVYWVPAGVVKKVKSTGGGDLRRISLTQEGGGSSGVPDRSPAPGS